MKVTQFKNRNFNLKAERSSEGLAYDIAYSMELDFAPFGEMYSLGNSALAWNYYNAQTGLVYVVSSLDEYIYDIGKPLKLVGRKPDEDDIEAMEQEGII